MNHPVKLKKRVQTSTGFFAKHGLKPQKEEKDVGGYVAIKKTTLDQPMPFNEELELFSLDDTNQ